MRKQAVGVSGWLRWGAVLCLMGCGSPLDEDRVEGLRHLSGTLQTNGSGTGMLAFKVEPGETAMLITGRSQQQDQVHVRSLFSTRDGEVFYAPDHLEGPRAKTNAAYVSPVVSLGWPVDHLDPELSSGRWQLTMGLADGDAQWSQGEMALDVLLKEDDDFTRGAVHASVVFAGGIEDDPDLVQGTEEALEVWAELYARYGFELSWDLSSHPNGDLYPPGLGSGEDYLALSSETPLRSVRVVISDVIKEYPDAFGMAGDIPGPLVPSRKSAVLVSAQLAAGIDGVFSDAEIRMFGETLAHESGHYLGLFHPVEIEYERWDALDDTPECHDQNECIELLATNLMFPFPVCTFVSCIPQNELTPTQVTVAHRHVVVD